MSIVEPDGNVISALLFFIPVIVSVFVAAVHVKPIPTLSVLSSSVKS